MSPSFEFLRQQLDSEPEAAQAILPSGQMVYVNAAWRSLLDYPRPPALTLTALVPPNEQDRIQRLLAQLFSDGRPRTLRTTLTARNGDWIRVQGRFISLTDDEHTIGWIVWQPLLRFPVGELTAPTPEATNPQALAPTGPDLPLQRSLDLLQLIMNHMPQAIFWKDRHTTYLGGNDLFARHAGFQGVHEIIGKTDAQMPWAATEAGWYHSWEQQVLETGQPVLDLIETQLRADGQLAWLKTSKVPLQDAEGNIIGILGTYEDITDRKGAEDQLQIKQTQLEALLNNIPHLAWIKDAAGHYIDLNTPFAETFGFQREKLIGKTDYDLAAADLASQYRASDQQAMDSGDRCHTQETIINAEGQLRWLETIRTPIYDPGGQVMGTIGIALDITDRKRTEAELTQHRHRLEELVAARTCDLEREIHERRLVEQQLFQEKELAQVTLQAIADGVITTNTQGQVVYLNPIAEQLTRWPIQQAKDQPINDVFPVIDEVTRRPYSDLTGQSLIEGKTVQFINQLVLIAPDGIEYDVDVSTAPIHDRLGRIIGTVLVFRDVTHTRLISREVNWQASHDTLTGLINRFRFEEILVEALQNLTLEGQQSILCYLDLDQFKVVNDTCGHLAGDELLRQVAELLKRQLRPSDVLARLGGDEFGVLLKPCNLDEAEVIADRLRACIHDFRFFWQQKAFTIGVSIGLVVISEGDQTLATALSAADAACYAAKDGGRNRVHVYQANDVEMARQRRERQWSLRIQQSLIDNRFCLYRQIIVPSQVSDPPVAPCYELLVRMIDEEGKIVPPGAFIPAAERYSLMPELDRWVIRTFLEWDLQSLQQGTGNFSSNISSNGSSNGFSNGSSNGSSNSAAPARLYMINLSGASVSDILFLAWVLEQLRLHIDKAPYICFEITETAAITNFNQARQFIKAIKDMGCCFALDDFGSGMSSFAYLRHLPVDFLKIDGNFIEDMTTEPKARAIVEAIHSVGHTMGIETIAEYVNTPEIAQDLRAIGVDYLQGYGIAKPEPFITPQAFSSHLIRQNQAG